MPVMRLSSLLPAGVLLAGIALLAVSCGPGPTETAPIVRGTALPPPAVPPGVAAPPAR